MNKYENYTNEELYEELDLIEEWQALNGEDDGTGDIHEDFLPFYVAIEKELELRYSGENR